MGAINAHGLLPQRMYGGILYWLIGCHGASSRRPASSGAQNHDHVQRAQRPRD